MPAIDQHRGAIVEGDKENRPRQVNRLGVLFVEVGVALPKVCQVNLTVCGAELHDFSRSLLDEPVALGCVPVPLRAGCVGEGEDLIAQVKPHHTGWFFGGEHLSILLPDKSRGFRPTRCCYHPDDSAILEGVAGENSAASLDGFLVDNAVVVAHLRAVVAFPMPLE